MVKCHLWIDGEEIEPAEFPAAPVVGDIIKDNDDHGKFYRVVSRQFDTAGPMVGEAVLYLHLEGAEAP